MHIDCSKLHNVGDNLPHVTGEDFIPLPATTSRGLVKQVLSVTGGALDLLLHTLATDKRYS
jgi:hypothetical protein